MQIVAKNTGTMNSSRTRSANGTRQNVQTRVMQDELTVYAVIRGIRLDTRLQRLRNVPQTALRHDTSQADALLTQETTQATVRSPGLSKQLRSAMLPSIRFAQCRSGEARAITFPSRDRKIEMARKRKKTTACNEGREFPGAKRQEKLDRTRTSEDLFVCEIRLRKCRDMLSKTFFEALKVATEGIRDADGGRVLDDASRTVPLDNFDRVMIPLDTIGRALAQWAEDVDELIYNEFEFAKSPFASKDSAAINPIEISC